MNILVTGGSGYLGQHLVQTLLEKGHALLNIDLVPNSAVETVLADVQDAQKIAPYFRNKDVVFHLASLIEVGESVAQPQRYFQNNVLGTINVLEAMKQFQVPRLIFSSSAAVYGNPVRVPIQEDDRTLPVNPYGTTKLAMEGLAASYAASTGMTGVALRYFNLYGPGWHNRPPVHAIPRFFEQLEQGREVTVWGDGQHQRDFVYMDDVVAAHLLAMNVSGGYHYLNLSGKNATKVLDLIQLLAQIMGKPAKIQHYPFRPGDPLLLFADASKAQKELGWEPQMDLPEGLRRTVEWYRAHPRE